MWTEHRGYPNRLGPYPTHSVTNPQWLVTWTTNLKLSVVCPDPLSRTQTKSWKAKQFEIT